MGLLKSQLFFLGDLFLYFCFQRTVFDNWHWESPNSKVILKDLKDINVRFFCSRFWELVVTRSTDVLYCASFVPNPVVNSFSRRVVEQDYSIVLQVVKNRMSLYIQATFFRQLFSVLLLFEYNGWHFQLRKGWDPVRFWILQLQDNSIFS